MKNLLKKIVIISILFISVNANAQITFGARAGLNLASMSISPAPGNGITIGMVPGLNIGAVAEYSLPQNLAVEAGLFLSSKGVSLNTNSTQSGQGISVTVNGTQSITPLYLEIPINAIYKIEVNKIKAQIFAGPYLAFGIGGKSSTDLKYSATGLPSGITLASMGLTNSSSSTDIKFGSTTKEDLSGTDFGLNFGVGVELQKLQLRLQYGLGLTNLVPTNPSTQSFKNGVLGISVGYMF